MRMGYLVSDRTTLLKRFDELIEHGKALLPFQNDLGYLAKKQKWVTGCQHILERTFGDNSAYRVAFQDLLKLGNQEAHMTHGLALIEGAKEEIEKGTAERTDTKQASTTSFKTKTNKVFIVHGRNHKPLNELKTVLLDLGLDPVILFEKPSGSMTIIEKLEKYSQDVGFAFVILTPDDALTTAIEISSNQYMHSVLSPIFRTRQNVILEFGYFIAKLGRKGVCCLYKGTTELPYDMPSDMHGIVYVPFKDSVDEAKDMLIKELRAAGYEIKTKEKRAKEGTEDELKKLRDDIELLKRRGINEPR